MANLWVLYMKDKVTISLYSIETNDAVGYKTGFLNEFDNIQKIRNGLCKAAEESKREAPEFIVSVLLVPDWDRQNNSYKDEQYLANKSRFVEAAKNKFE
ncbi:MAG TPA: hypothetical protein VHA13_02790, partial [Gammaproteobacteria bacterium]|nr:hypothetical protein [Gammaproteobacteria bacterium]